ncbi:hypothetical protein GCM10028819_13130 [Spirosoma humi]
MDELDKNLSDDFWRKTFEDASEMPPPRVWGTIEQRLDESSGPKVLPLWGTGLASSRSLIWGAGMAAAVALLLVGWWAVNFQSTKQLAAQEQPIDQANNVANSHSEPSTATDASPTSHARRAQTDAVASTTAKSVVKSAQPINGLRSRAAATAAQNAQPLVAQTDPKSARGGHSQHGPTVLMAASAAQQTLEHPESRRSSNLTATTSYPSGSQSFIATDASVQNTVVFNKLIGKPLRMRRPGSIQRIVWIRPMDLETEPEVNKSKRQPRELWASVNMMPGSFNPMVSVRSMQSSFSNTALASANVSSQSSVSSRANYSMAYQAGAGVQLSERWSVESGIGYLSGHATVETTGQSLATGQMDLLANRIGTGGNAYIDALRNSSQNVKFANNAPQASYNNTIAYVSPSYVPSANQTIQTVNNDYQYVQVPVQVGYQLRPRKKLSMAVIGGLLTNIFVKNTVGDALVVTNKDGVYRPVSLAATMGARLRYRPTRQWSASIAGMYQPALESSTKADAQVQGRPTSAGMSFGVDYHF